MTYEVAFQQLEAINLPLGNIFLDPNNPRFIESDWKYVSDHDIESVQELVKRQLEMNFSVDKLRMNMEINGYLPIDRVVVREFAKDRYVVLEGNRRICAAKQILDMEVRDTDISEEVFSSLRVIPCLQYTGSEHEAAWIFQGIRHITGVHEWSAFAKAKLLVEQKEKEDLSLTDVGKRFGLTAHGAGQWVRGYSAYKQAQEESDFVTEVKEQAYPYFQELFSNSSLAVREWMGWDDQNMRFTDKLAFNTFIGWLYPRQPDESGDSENGTGLGNWDSRWLARRDDIRSVAYLLKHAREEFYQFQQGMKLEQAYAMAQQKRFESEAKAKVDRISEVFDAIATCTKALEDIPHKAVQDVVIKQRLDDALAALRRAMEFL